MRINKKIIFYFIIIFIIIVIVFLLSWFRSNSDNSFSGEENIPTVLGKKYQKIQLNISSNKFSAYVADTDEKRIAGLSNWNNLKPYEAMFFVFTEPNYHGIWMKDMKISLDIIWLDENSKIIYIKENILPNTFPKIFKPDSPALYVIELPAGTISQNKISLGMVVSKI
ncbi:MAG: DUF192 domain-containing protein [Minisyncoccia bacterium]